MDLDQTQARANPSPQNYTIPSKFGREAPKFSLGSRIPNAASSPTRTAPDPFTYSPRLQKTARDITFAGRTKGTANFATPAPDAYNIPQGNSLPKFSMSGRVNMPGLLTVSNGPAPNSYSPSRSPEKKGATLSGRTQFGSMYQVNQSTSNLAPNSYMTERRVGADSPSFTFKGRVQIQQNNTNPGPGTYKHFEPVGNTGQQITIASKPRVRGLVLKE